MTEKREPYTIPDQYDLWGNLAPPAGINRDKRVAYILERWPDTRDDDRLLMLQFWTVFDSMDEVLGAEGADKFRDFFMNATHFETIRRGRAGIQELRTDAGHLLPDSDTIRYRRARDGAGPPRG